MGERIADTVVLASALNDLSAQELLRKTIGFQKSLEVALADADERVYGEERRFKKFRTAMAKKGGAAAKADPLHMDILRIVRGSPNITEPELRNQLKMMFGRDFDNENKAIDFSAKGKEKSAPLSGLKDRLFRAKKQIRDEKKSNSR